MVDHDPIPESTLEQAKAAYKIVCPTEWAVKQFYTHGLDALHIPFGIDTKVFKPSQDKAADKVWLNKRSVSFSRSSYTDIDEDSFVVVVNGANKDPYRKAFSRVFIATQLFLEQNPDAKKDFRLYIHSWMRMARDIPHGASVLHVEEYCRGCSDYHALCGVPDNEMSRIYGAADVLMHLSQAGGFEIPVLESLSCGVPPICSDFINMHELAAGHSWLVPCKTRYFTPLDSTACIVDEFKAAEALEDAYNHPEKREKLGQKGRKHALQFDWSKVNPLWYRLFDGMIEESRYKPLKERQL